MLKINPAPTFDFDVEIAVPGQAKPEVISLTGRYKNAEQVDAWIKAGKDEPSEGAFLFKAVAGWRKVVEDDGTEVKFDVQALDKFCTNYPGAPTAIFTAYLAELRGARAKNS